MESDNLTPLQKVNLAGGVTLPAFIGTIYGIAYYFEYPQMPRSVSGILVLGGIASLLIAQKEMWVFYMPTGRSWGRAFSALSILIPYGYSLFLMGYLGLWTLWRDISGYHGVGPMLAALFWIAVGWRMLFALGKISRAESN